MGGVGENLSICQLPQPHYLRGWYQGPAGCIIYLRSYRINNWEGEGWWRLREGESRRRQGEEEREGESRRRLREEEREGESRRRLREGEEVKQLISILCLF